MKTAEIGVENCNYSFDALFSYIIPSALSDFVVPGMRVLVPFGNGNRKRQGFVFSVSENPVLNSKVKLKEIFSVLDARPLISEELLGLARFLRDRTFSTYFASAKALLPGGMCMKTEKTYIISDGISEESLTGISEECLDVLSFLKKKGGYIRESLILKNSGLRTDSPVLKILESKGLVCVNAEAFTRVTDLSVSMLRLSDGIDFEGELNAATPKQKNVLTSLCDMGSASMKELCYYSGVTSGVVKLLLDKGVIESYEEEKKRTPISSYYTAQTKDIVLTDEQRNAFTALYEEYRKHTAKTALLYGVTGSGKTNVYLELIDRVISDGKSVIVLVPEISLTPQTFSLFCGRYGKNIAILHSALSAGERYDEWKRIKNGEAKIVIGTRSAVFAPVENLGLIIIDEEQEHTYKSEMSPRYDAKDAAKYRCAFNNALLVLASATPSVETYAKALSGQYMLCELNSRYGGAVLPRVKTVDMTDKTVLTSFFAISNPLADEIQHNLDSHEQSILLMNRRGYNTFVVCSDCKQVITCPKCSISMTYHSANNRLMCHYCGYSEAFTEECPSCGAKNIRYSGFGTQRVEQELQLRFPAARVLRMDADTTVAKNSHETALTAFSQGQYDILLGTQMVAKGLDFSNVTLVGILSVDKELYNNDFRSTERTFDLITQVVGRAGRGNKEGRAVIQTVAPDNDILSVAAKQDYKSFYNTEIAMRRAMVYPPFCDICVIGFTGTDNGLVKACARSFFDNLVKLNSEKLSSLKIIVLGPLAPRVSKVNNNFRQRIIIKCKNNPAFRSFINELLNMSYSDKTFSAVAVYADMNPDTVE